MYPKSLSLYPRVMLTESIDHLPALHNLTHDTWTTGYDAIVPVVNPNHAEGLTPAQQADAVAYSAHLSSRLGPLLDLTLYALPRNWVETTRPAYSAILPFPLTWTVPTAQRAAAVERVHHIVGDLSLEYDDDDAAGKDRKDQSALDAALKHLPTNRKKGVLEEMAPGQAATIRLHAMAVDALSVLEDLHIRGGKATPDPHSLLVPGHITSFDCLAFGYLSLARAAPVPQDFLRRVLATRFTSLSTFTADMERSSFDAPGPLPWAEGDVKSHSSASRTLGRFLDDVLRVTSRLGDVYATGSRRRAEAHAAGEALLDRHGAVFAGFVLALVPALAYGGWWYKHLPAFGLRTQTWAAQRAGRLAEYGALGAMLDFSLGSAPASMFPGSQGSQSDVD